MGQIPVDNKITYIEDDAIKTKIIRKNDMILVKQFHKIPREEHILIITDEILNALKM